jgi:hypothetical protein
MVDAITKIFSSLRMRNHAGRPNNTEIINRISLIIKKKKHKIFWKFG